MRFLRLGLVCSVCVWVMASAAHAQHGKGSDDKPEMILKETRADGGRVLDASGLTERFVSMFGMLRSSATLDIGDEQLQIHSGRLPARGVDYENFKVLDSGIVQFQAVAPIKLRTPRDLEFDQLAIKAGNVAADYPGLYSLWLKKSADGAWSLVFNGEPDIWGTMHETQADVGEVKLAHTTEEGKEVSLGVSIVESEAGAVLNLAWGEHRWSTPFAVK